MNGYLLDTNIVTAHLKKHPGVRERMRAAELTGSPGAIECCELL